MKKTLIFTLCLLLVFLAGCGGTKQGYKKEKNTGDNATSFPYIVRTPSAVWYLSAADIEKMGEEAFDAGLERILKDQEADFADAREALADYLQEDVPPIDIFTDFAGQTEIGGWGIYGAYYRSDNQSIRVFGDWDVAGATLLHEYAHYLSITCCDLSLTDGFWAEAVANYVSMLQCRNRMARAVDNGMNEESAAFFKEHGAVDPETGELDLRLYYYGSAAVLGTEAAIGSPYFSVSGSVMPMSERQQQHPLMSAVSHFEAACLLEYLVEQYGRETVFAHFDCDQTGVKEVYGKSFEELFAEWSAEHFARCEELGLNLDVS